MTPTTITWGHSQDRPPEVFSASAPSTGSTRAKRRAPPPTYTATTVNPTNNWATGTVALADDDNSTAAFTAINLKPASTGTKVHRGHLQRFAGLHVEAVRHEPNLHQGPRRPDQPHGRPGRRRLVRLLHRLTALASGSELYTGTVAGFAGSYTGVHNGLGNWAPTGTANETRSYQVTYTVKGDAPDTTQGGTAALGLTFEAQNS